MMTHLVNFVNCNTLVDMLAIQPTATRYVTIRHTAWDAAWQLQFPESIGARQAWLMDFQPIYPVWEQLDDGSWHYRWRGDAAYVAEQAANQPQSGPAEVKHFLAGAEVAATLTVEGNALLLRLALTNHTGEWLTQVICDGGCFQARSALFAAPDEVRRSYITVNDALCSLAELPRTQPERCVYHSDQTNYDFPPDKGGEWFWGRSSAVISAPVIVAMASVDGQRAVAFGYDCARSGAANADDHHCLHARPFFGDLAPGETAIAHGAIVFADSLAAAAAGVRRQISAVARG